MTQILKHRFGQLFFWSILICSILQNCSQSDPCKTSNCGANASCFDGNCFCELGYEGASCNSKWTDQYAGTWAGKTYFSYQNDTLPPFSKSNSVVITSLDATQITIKNFGGLTGNLLFKLNKKNSFSIDAFSEAEKIQIKGTATLVNPNKIEFNFIQKNYSLDKKDFDCVGTLTK